MAIRHTSGAGGSPPLHVAWAFGPSVVEEHSSPRWRIATFAADTPLVVGGSVNGTSDGRATLIPGCVQHSRIVVELMVRVPQWDVGAAVDVAAVGATVGSSVGWSRFVERASCERRCIGSLAGRCGLVVG